MNRTLLMTVGLCLFGAARNADAQGVIAPLPQAPVVPPALEAIETNDMKVLSPNSAIPSTALETPLQWGPVNLRPHFLYRFLYGDGILSSAGHPVNTVIHAVLPGMILGLGDHWTVDYSPTLTFYSNKQFRDTTDQNVILTGATSYGDWVLGLSQVYNHSTQPLVETGKQTSQDTYGTALTATYLFNSALLLDLSANQNFNFPQGLTETREWSTIDWLSYVFGPGLDAGLGAGFGYVDVSQGADSRYDQGQGRIRWRVVDKIALQAHGGVEDRQFLGSGTGDLISPLFGASVQYQPFDITSLTLSADHAVSQSLTKDQATESTSAAANLSQRLLKRLYLNVGGSYRKTKYVATTAGTTADREDDNYSVNVRLSTTLLKRGTVAATYQFSRNSSNQGGFGYSSNQIGFEVGYRY